MVYGGTVYDNLYDFVFKVLGLKQKISMSDIGGKKRNVRDKWFELGRILNLQVIYCICMKDKMPLWRLTAREKVLHARIAIK